MLEERPTYLLEQMVFNESLTMQQLCAKTNLTKRQIEYDLSKINDWLMDKELPTIHYKGTEPILPPQEIKHYFIERKRETYDRIYISNDIREYVTYLYLFIRKEAVSTNHLNQFLSVSRNTSMNVIKKTNSYAEDYLVRVTYTRGNGYHLKGREMDKRAVAFQCVSQLLQKKNGIAALQSIIDNWRLPAISTEQISKLTSNLQSIYQLTFVEERLTDFQYFLLFYYSRLKQAKFISYHQDDKQKILENKMVEPAKALLRDMKVPVLEDEVTYMVTHLLGLSLGESTGKEDLLLNLCEKLLSDFEAKTCTYFPNKEQVLISLYQHFKPAYHRIIYRIPIMNNMLTQIKEEYSNLFTIVKELVVPIENVLSLKIPEDEIGYLTIHFGAFLKRPAQTREKEFQAVIVCPSGISSSIMLKSQLTSLFPTIHFRKALSIQEFHEITPDSYDVLFSTISIQTDKPLFIVKPVMTSLEKDLLQQEFHARVSKKHAQALSVSRLLSEIRKHATIHNEKELKQTLYGLLSTESSQHEVRGHQPMLNELITENTIQFRSSVDSWEAAIHCVAEPLLEDKKIEARYADAIINKVKEFGPYISIAPGIAIPHARPEDGVSEIGMSLLVLDEPITILDNDTNPIRLLICIAAIDNVTHLKAMAQLTRLLNQKENQEKLMNAASKEEILSLIAAYSKNE